MNDAEKHKLEDKLRQAAPLSSFLVGPPIEVPERVKATLDRARHERFPLVKELEVGELKALILKILSTHPCDGFELIDGLVKAKCKLKGAGEGVIYGILSTMEDEGMLEGQWRESSSRMLKTYRVTDKGAKLLEPRNSTSVELGDLANSVLKQMPS